MDYETLDIIADSYIPVLTMAFFVGLVARTIKKPCEWRFLLQVFIYFACLLSVSYGIMLLDNALQAWPSFHLDYSTHTAVSLTFVLSICAVVPQCKTVVTFSFLLYALLMFYQQYHTVLDVISTIIPIGLSALLLVRLLFLQTKDNKF